MQLIVNLVILGLVISIAIFLFQMVVSISAVVIAGVFVGIKNVFNKVRGK